jgi:hypothetical protein
VIALDPWTIGDSDPVPPVRQAGARHAELMAHVPAPARHGPRQDTFTGAALGRATLTFHRCGVDKGKVIRPGGQRRK